MTTTVDAIKALIFRPRSDGNTPIVLGQRRVFILPSGAGLRFAGTLLVILIGAINYNLALGHALVFLLAGLGLTGMVHTFRNLYGLEIVAGRCKPVFAGETASFSLTLINHRGQTRQALEIAHAKQLLLNCRVPAHGSTVIHVPLAATRRGWFELPRLRLHTRFPLGFFIAWSYLQPSMRCLVYPRPIASPLPETLATGRSGEQQGNAGQEDFAGFRDRQAADSLRHVAWKASARRPPAHPLLVKQFSGGARPELQLDWDQCTAHDDESRLSQLCGWVLAAEAAALCYGLRLPGQEIPPGCGLGHQQRCLELLARYPAPPA